MQKLNNLYSMDLDKLKNYYHLFVIVGRGRHDLDGCLNLPLNPQLDNINTLYVDPNAEYKPDVVAHVQNLNFDSFGVTQNTDINGQINLFFCFDYSSFFCTALDALPLMAKHINRPFVVFVPLGPNENSIPSEVPHILHEPHFSVKLIYGRYPLFDWDNSNSKGLHAATYINKNVYIGISVAP